MSDTRRRILRRPKALNRLYQAGLNFTFSFFSKRAACRKYDLSWHTLKKILAHHEPPGYRRKQPRRKPTLEPFLPIIHEILEQDQQAPKKQRHTAWRIFERLRDEHISAAAIRS